MRCYTLNNNNPKLKKNAQNLRKGMTKEERHLWYDFLKGLSVTVHRQKVMGNYILDFYIASKKIAIELDGSQHFEEDGIKKDEARDDYLQKRGILVLRYTNLEIARNFDDVCRDIWKHVYHTSSTASGPPSP